MGRRGGQHTSSGIMLIPTPSKDPNDSFNWVKGKKYLMLACVSLYIISASILSSDLYSVFDPLSPSTGLSLDQLHVGTGYLYLFVGISTLISQPCSIAFGKKPAYLVSAFGAASSTFGPRSLEETANDEPVECYWAFSFHRHSPWLRYRWQMFFSCMEGPILISGYIYEGIGWKVIIWLSTGWMAIVGFVLFLFPRRNLFPT